MKRTTLCLLLLPALTACKETEEAGRTTGISLGEAEAVVPRKGQWFYDVWQWTAHECGITDDDLPIDTEEGFKITEAGPEAFELYLNQDIQFRCNLNGDAFLCEEVSTTSTYSDGLIELDIELQTEGHLPQESFMIGHHQLYLDCVGDGCTAVEAYFDVEFPCEAGIDFNAFHE
jgi:hypothetical protein